MATGKDAKAHRVRKATSQYAVRGSKVQKEIRELRERVATLEQELGNLRASLGPQEVLVLRDISREQAKQEILRLFCDGGVYWYSDIVERLRLDLQMVIELCGELIEEGELQSVGDAVQQR